MLKVNGKEDFSPLMVLTFLKITMFMKMVIMEFFSVMKMNKTVVTGILLLIILLKTTVLNRNQADSTLEARHMILIFPVMLSAQPVKGIKQQQLLLVRNPHE